MGIVGKSLLDPRKIFELTELHRDRHTTLILVTHDLTIAALAARTLRMKDGRIVHSPPDPVAA